VNIHDDYNEAPDGLTMSATIIQFPTRIVDGERLALAGSALQAAVPLPSKDAELDLLLQIGGKLLDNLNDCEAVDCWLVRLDQWQSGV
jgi:hypothetical protein